MPKDSKNSGKPYRANWDIIAVLRVTRGTAFLYLAKKYEIEKLGLLIYRCGVYKQKKI